MTLLITHLPAASCSRSDSSAWAKQQSDNDSCLNFSCCFPLLLSVLEISRCPCLTNGASTMYLLFIWWAQEQIRLHTQSVQPHTAAACSRRHPLKNECHSQNHNKPKLCRYYGWGDSCVTPPSLQSWSQLQPVPAAVRHGAPLVSNDLNYRHPPETLTVITSKII